MKDFSSKLIELALKEDIGTEDVTSELLIDENSISCARIVAKQDGVISGLDIAGKVFKAVNPSLRLEKKVKDGAYVKKGRIVAIVYGKTMAILAAERTALNFLQRLSGIATLTRQFTDKLKGTGVKLLDTRKTSPGLRALEKAAVKAGGGLNHRMGLYDAILVKDNHLAVIKQLDKNKLKGLSGRFVEIEAGNLRQVRNALEAGAGRILLDNMSIKFLSRCVKYIKEWDRKHNKHTAIEASGGITLKNVRKIAWTGVDFISAGAVTHSAKALDLSLKIDRTA